MKTRNEVKAIGLLAVVLLAVLLSAGAGFIATETAFIATKTAVLVVSALVGCWLLYKMILAGLNAEDYLYQVLNEREELRAKHSELLAERQKYFDQLHTKLREDNAAK